MAPLKPTTLAAATSVSALQTQMKADLKARGGQTDVKFLAAKNCQIGAKTLHLFIVTDTPALFEPVIKTRFPTALRAKGTCDVLPGPKDTLQVFIKKSTGAITPAATADLVRLAVASDKKIRASYQARSGTVDQPVKGDVPDWAQEKYRRKSVETVIASMSPDGKIGSIYFEGEGRIRTTHATGAKSAKHDDLTTTQFNIKREEAWAAFAAAKPSKAKSKDSKVHWQKWIKSELGQATPTNLPPWATLVTAPSTGYDISGGNPPPGMQLIEIFKNINGEVEGWHPSRGVAARFDTDKQTIHVLKAAIKHLDDQDLQDPNIRNIAFYEFVQSRLPNFAPYIRDPKTIKVNFKPKKKKKT